MRFEQTFPLRDGRTLLVRSCTGEDSALMKKMYIDTHTETDFLLSYPDEHTFTPESEARFLREKEESPREAELMAFVDGEAAGTAGIEAVGNKEKVRHRCEFGISVLKAYWGLGIGRVMLESCIGLAREAGYRQMELDVVADNARAISLYKSVGFTEYGCNPLGFVSRGGAAQALVLMRLELK